MNHLQRQVNKLVTFPPYLKDAGRSEAAEQVEKCVKWLHLQGFEVLGAQVGTRNPRITVRASPLCDQLDGAVRRFERTAQGERRYRVALRLDCEVRWADAEQSRGGKQ